LDHSGKQLLIGRIAGSHNEEAARTTPGVFASERRITVKAFGEEPSVHSQYCRCDSYPRLAESYEYLTNSPIFNNAL
jgi:hypothetical protein